MKHFAKIFRYVFFNFGSLITYITVNHFYGAKTAVIAAVLVGLVEIPLFFLKKQKLSPFYIFSFVTTILLGAIDISSTNPFVFKYESAVTSILFGLYFGGSLLIGKPVIQEFAEKTISEEKIQQPNTQKYLRLLTIVWTMYFFAKAGFYFYVANSYSIAQALAIRSVFGPVSTAVLLIGEKLLRSRFILALKNMGFLNH